MSVLPDKATSAAQKPSDKLGFDIELLKTSIAKVLKALRIKSGLSIDEAADISNINVGRVEREHPDILVSTINSLCSLYTIDISEFFSLVEQEIILAHSYTKVSPPKDFLP